MTQGGDSLPIRKGQQMNNDLLIPHIGNVNLLKQLARPFPVAAGDVLGIAQLWGFSDSTIRFLKLFPEDEMFESEDDFLTRAEELESMMLQEQDMPREMLRSPQD